jgi:DNA-binding HxlR family transcriptional regulator
MPTKPRTIIEPSSCPSARTLRLVANKWSVEILFELGGGDGAVRFRELQRRLGRITQKELTRHLRRLEANGLVAREIFAEVPPRVEYRLTSLGRSLLEPLTLLGRWSLVFDAARASEP